MRFLCLPVFLRTECKTRQAKGKRTAIRPRSTAREQGMTATVKAKAKFSSRNLNAVYKAPPSKTLEHAGESLSVAAAASAKGP